MADPKPQRGNVYQHERFAGVLERTSTGYRFTYDARYLADGHPPVSLTLPCRSQPYESPHLFPFFVSILAEGVLARFQCELLRLDEEDLFSRLLLTTGHDVIGSVQVRPEPVSV